jgi:fibronectin-binding autotransporter adhesin
MICTLAVLGGLSLRADTQYWDADGDLSNNDCATGAGLGGTNSWDGAFWTTNDCYNATDSPATWVEGNDAVFWGTNGTVTLNSPHSAGNMTVKSGTYSITGSTLALTNGCFTNNSGTTTIASIFAGMNGYKKYGAGTLYLNNAANSISNAVYVYGGTLRINNSSAFGANQPGQTLTLDGGTLRNDHNVNGGYLISRNVPIYIGAGGGTLNALNANTILLYSNAIYGVTAGVGTLTKAGAGELRCCGKNIAHNTYGKLVVSAGMFTAGHGTWTGYNDTFCAIPATPIDDAITLKSGGQIALSGNASVTLDAKQGITLGAGSGAIEAYSSMTFTINSSIKGAQPLTTGNGYGGVVVLAGTNTFGALTNSSGVLRIKNSYALGDTSTNATVLSGSTLQVSSTINVPKPLVLYGTGTNSAGGALQNLANNNVWSGPITLGESGVRIGSVTATLTLSGGVTGADFNLLVGGAGNVTISTNQLSLGAGMLTKDGTGTLSLNTSNYLASVTIDGGTILANATDGSATGAGTVTVNSGGMLGGNGIVAGAVSVSSGGGIGGGGTAGLLTLQSGVDLSAGGTNVWELAANSAANPGVDFDQVAVTGGNLLLGDGSTLLIRFIGTATSPDLTNSFWQAAHQWHIVAVSGTGSNPTLSGFGAIAGTNGITAGTFSTAPDGSGGVNLSYAPGALPITPVSSTSIATAPGGGFSISYSGGTGSQFVLVTTNNAAAPLSLWTRVDTNTAVNGAFTIPVSPAAAAFYRIKSE